MHKKTLLLGIVLGILAFPLLIDILRVAKINPTVGLTGYGSTLFIQGGCRDIQAKNGHGWKFILREYNECNRLSNYLSDLIYKRGK